MSCVHDAPVFWQAALTPGFKLLGQRLVEATDRTGDFEPLPAGFEPRPPQISRTHPGYEHLRESFGDVWFIATIAFKGLCMKLTLAISGNLQIFDATRGSDEIAVIEAVAISFPFGTTLSPADSNEAVSFLAHDALQPHANGIAGQFTQILSESLLVRQRWGCLLWR